MIYLIEPSNYSLHRDDLDAMYRLRHKIFFEKLNWKVNSHNGMEKDEYDENNTYYLVYKDKNNIISGCQRYICMAHACMFDGPFKFVLPNLQDFKKSKYWEASRLSVDYNGYHTQKEAISICQRIFIASIHFGLEQGIEQFLTLSYPSVARLLTRYFSTSLVTSSNISNKQIIVTSYPPIKQSYDGLLAQLNLPENEPIFHQLQPNLKIFTSIR